MSKEQQEDSQQIFSEIKNPENFGSPPSELQEIRCPLCPKFAKITINQIKNEIISECPDNHFMKLDFLSFIEKSTDHPINSTKCSICNSIGKTNHYCLECNKYLCENCLEKHNKNDLPFNNGGMHSNILLRNNTLESNTNTGNTISTPLGINNSSFPNHLSNLNLINNNNNSSINTVQHHIININEQDNHCAIHNNEKFVALCLKCNKSFCQKCLEEIKKGTKNNLNVLSCGKFGNINHNIKKMKDIVGEKRLNKIKQCLDKENEIINYIENQSNIIIEQILEKINNLREIHLLKKQLYNLYLLNQENASLVNTMTELGNGFNLQTSQFNTNEKLLNNLEIINIQLPQKIEDNKNDNNIINNNKEEAKKEEGKKEQNAIDKKNELKKLKEEKKKEIQRMKEEKKKEIKQKKEEMKKLKLQKKKELKEKKNADKKEDNKGGENEKPQEGETNIDNTKINNGNSNP